MLFPTIRQICADLEQTFERISSERKLLLERVALFIQQKRDKEEQIQLVYVCTHNSRRSHFGQVWAKVAATYFNVPEVETYSAGTEATAMHTNTIEALISQGFKITQDSTGDNPIYTVKSGEAVESKCYSKTLSDDNLPLSNFAALMTCSDADENCPFIPGSELRVATKYEDPKIADGTPQQLQTYQERSLEIARECLYVFSLIQ